MPMIVRAPMPQVTRTGSFLPRLLILMLSDWLQTSFSLRKYLLPVCTGDIYFTQLFDPAHLRLPLTVNSSLAYEKQPWRMGGSCLPRLPAIHMLPDKGRLHLASGSSTFLFELR
jgi:hypothetical protein